jgi:hypothetical protein
VGLIASSKWAEKEQVRPEQKQDVVEGEEC